MLFSKPVCGGDIEAQFGINFTKMVASVSLPKAVKQASILERVKSTCFHIWFVRQARSRCSKGMVILPTGASTLTCLKVWVMTWVAALLVAGAEMFNSVQKRKNRALRKLSLMKCSSNVSTIGQFGKVWMSYKTRPTIGFGSDTTVRTTPVFLSPGSSQHWYKKIPHVVFTWLLSNHEHQNDQDKWLYSCNKNWHGRFLKLKFSMIDG